MKDSLEKNISSRRTPSERGLSSTFAVLLQIKAYRGQISRTEKRKERGKSARVRARADLPRTASGHINQPLATRNEHTLKYTEKKGGDGIVRLKLLYQTAGNAHTLNFNTQGWHVKRIHKLDLSRRYRDKCGMPTDEDIRKSRSENCSQAQIVETPTIDWGQLLFVLSRVAAKPRLLPPCIPGVKKSGEYRQVQKFSRSRAGDHFFINDRPLFGLCDDDSEINTVPIDNPLPSRGRKKSSAACQTGFVVLRQEMPALQGCL